MTKHLPQPIPISAASPVEYIPSVMDVDAYRLLKSKEIDGLERELRAAAEQDDAKPEALSALRQKIEAERGMMASTIDLMGRKYPKPITFLIQTPTPIERDQINSRLVMMGLTQVTQQQIRATMIEELFAHDWGKGDDAANEAYAEEVANFLDGVWLRQETHDAAIERWQEQEIQRVMDEADGAPSRERAALPPKIITVRENARQQNIIDEMMLSRPRLRELASRNLDFSRRNAILLVRMHVVGARQAGSAIEGIARDPVTNALPEETANRLRDLIGDVAAWNDLVGYIDRLYSLDESERKNFDSPLEKPSPIDGFPAPSGGQENSAGNSTASNIGQAPAGESATIIELSSASTSGSSMEPEAAAPSNSLTGEG